MDSHMRVFTPGEAASELGVTTQSLRRYAHAYAEVFEPIGQHAGQRVFTDEVLDRLRSAQALLMANKAPSIKAALELLRDGTVEPPAVRAGPSFEEAVLARLEALTLEVKALREENRMLREALPKPQEKRRRWWWPWWW